MRKNIFAAIVAGFAALALAGCDPIPVVEEPKDRVDFGDIICENPMVSKEVHAGLTAALNAGVGEVVPKNFPELLDSEKIVRGFDRSRLVLNSAKLDSAMAQSPNKAECVAGLNVMLDHAVYDLALSNAPLVYPDNSYASQIDNVASMNRVSRMENNLVMDVHYSLNLDDKRSVSSVLLLPQEIGRLERVVRTMLLPYGAKDRIPLDGRIMSREEALVKLSFAGKDFGSAERTGDPLGPDALAEVADPPGKVDEAALIKLRADRNRAMRRLDSVWKSLEPGVRGSLRDEQRAWRDDMRRSCGPEASKYSAGTSNELDELKCQIDKISERVSYLKGFGI